MLRSSYFWRLYAGSLASILLMMAGAFVLGSRGIEAAALQRATAQLAQRALGLRAPALEILARGEAGALPLGIAFDPELRVSVVRRDGVVLADSREEAGALQSQAGRAELRAALESGEPSTGVLQLASLRVLTLADPLRDARGELVGSLLLSRSLRPAEEARRALRGALLVSGAAAALLAAGLAFAFARRLAGSLRSMTAVAEAMAAGGYHQRVRWAAQGELGRLARAFDTMAEELERRVEAVTTDRNRIAAILAGMAEGVVAIDREERVVHMNQVAARLLRVPRFPVEGLHVWEATRLEAVREILVEAMRAKVPVRRELRAGAEGPALELHAGPLTDGRAEVVGAVLLLNDVSELRRLEGIRRDFVANVSHELKTPLTAIRGLIETILDDPEMEPALRQRFLERVEEQSMRLSTLVTDLLTISRLESESSRREREVVDFREVVSASLAQLRPGAEAKRIRLEAELSPEAQWVLGDPEELRQMVDNLVDNAIKYTPERGEVRVRLGVAERREGRPESCLLEVVDTGIGIDPRHQERIFERFYRVDKARSRELGGTGLGLAIVKHVAKDAGGRVSLESTPGLGSTFRVILPLAR